MSYPPKTARNRRILRKRAKGFSFGEIAKLEGISKTMVYKTYRRWANVIGDK